MPAHINNPKEFLMHKMHLLVNAEMQIKDALTLVCDMVQDAQLKQGAQTHLEQTQSHLDRLGRVMEKMGFTMMDMQDEAVRAMIEQGTKLANVITDPKLRDMAIVGSMKHIEAYEKLCYKMVIEKAQMLGMQNEVSELEQSLNEEETMFENLEKLGKSMMQ